ncbi:Der GTPase-activating protein YihI [Xenorhabdus szentirmaii]|uniref:Der GTPase-activating protein YihI n=2 Tax=Xenorhabdus szentirmaii TaxID=290112 RepID=W1J4K0_9GAMM|nr:MULTISPECIES: Der GTPase-activating protein YihI [Xenorhabdus]MBD2790718.1 Der GTPase-activating protein YihI [Xenorhabdus sp. CUL]MBD2800165.1 Der GTPase-activating protein YihI [Xenorhabdus sp. M]MBD2820690.1 Der GTPase-activating protein YihI [Xenorhabdus sp. 42]MBD2824066.1 Der GTPase-activating protein YihI [Xenorhabdus sp. 5]PHM34559.1 GTPase-activating protein [Xenorhabdus szentirmaii DSM 16338]
MSPLNRKSPAKPSAGKQKRKSRAELDAEGRERKREKKRRGNPTGSRSHGSSGKKNTSTTQQKADPRIGSKVPVPLIADDKVAVAKPATKPKAEKQKPRLSPQEELAMLENDERLDDLLARLEQGEKLSQEDNVYVDNILDRIDTLMEELGINLEEDNSEEEEKQQEDIMQLLKGK